LRSVRPRILALAAVALLLGVALAAVAVMSVAALPVALVLGLTVIALVIGVGTRRQHRAGRHPRRPPPPAVVGHDAPVTGSGVSSQLRWATFWDAGPPVHALPDTRERVAVVLAEWGLTGEAVEPTLLVVTELLSNAAEHGHGPGWLAVELADGSVHVEVRDDTPEPPHLRRPDPSQVRGRGLQLVDALSQWGWTDDPPGKVVWADVTTRWPV
jgi:anti-sigma regulatory factor (Ser/Thr protein kinase)